jgi:hypothetical protein
LIDTETILFEIQEKLYKKDVDFSLNIFLCGAETKKKDSIRDLLNIAFRKDAKFNSVYPEYIFASLYSKGGENLLELEDDLANYVDVIVLPLEGIGTYCELGAFAVNKSLLPKIIAINNSRYKKSKSFINLGPIDLIKKHNPSNLIYFNDGEERLLIPKIVDKVKFKRYNKIPSYNLENLFNLSRFLLYLIAIYQPIDRKNLETLITILGKGKLKTKYVESAIQILTQKNRIEQDIDASSFNSVFSLSEDGHKYVYEELITKLNVKRDFSAIRAEIINDRYRKRIKKVSKVKKLLV